MQFEGGETASFVMAAFSEKQSTRETKIIGSRGELEFRGKTISVHDFVTNTHRTTKPALPKQATVSPALLLLH